MTRVMPEGLVPYKNEQEFLDELHEALMEYTDWIPLSHDLLLRSAQGIDNLLHRFL